MMIEILKGKDYTPHRTGWVVLVDGQPHHRDTKREAEELKQRLLDFEASRKMQVKREKWRVRLLELGDRLKEAFPSYHWMDVGPMWVTHEPRECEMLKLWDRTTAEWREALKVPNLIPVFHDCEGWAGFTLD
jgi:hypothetical protein